MKAANLIDAIKKKFGETKDRAIAVRLGVSVTTLNNWRNSGLNLTPTQVATLLHRSVAKCEREARLFSIRPIIEYYPLDPAESPHGTRLEVFNHKENNRFKAIRENLKNANGIYVFYDSQCKALYVGKAKKQSLWDEMNSAYNRGRETQKLFTVSHPTTGQTFLPAHTNPRQIRKLEVQLYDLASYFSAYKIDSDLIDNIEAMLVRAFANTILNTRMEKVKVRI